MLSSSVSGGASQGTNGTFSVPGWWRLPGPYESGLMLRAALRRVSMQTCPPSPPHAVL